MDQEKRMNKHPTLCPFFGEQQPWDHRHGRDHLGLTAFLCPWFPKLGGRKQGAVPQAWLPQHLFISLFVLMLGRPSLVPFSYRGGARA